MLHHVILVALAALWIAVACATREGRPRWRPGVRRGLEWTWSLGLTLLLAEALATVLGLGEGTPPAWLTGSRGDAPDPEPSASEKDRRPTPAREEAPVVLFMGDSFTYGQGVATPDSLPNQVLDIMAQGGIPIDARNEGESGDSFVVEANRYVGLYEAVDPDVVVWVFVLNDFGVDTPIASDDFIVDRRADVRTGVRLIDAVVRARRERQLTATTEAAYREALRASTPLWGASGEVLGQLVAERRAVGGRFVVAIYPLLHRLADYPFGVEHERIATWAREAGAEVVDLLPAFRGADEEALWVSRADHHPNARGHRMASEAIAAALGGRSVRRGEPGSALALSHEAVLAKIANVEELIRQNAAKPEP